MKEQVPSYIIKYIECQEEGHKGQKVNLICLNPECHDHSLICSLCTPKHRGHTYKPIKIYLDELYGKYQVNKASQEQDLEELEKRKLLLLHHLKVCVEKISEEFMKLEEDILFTYEKIKNQIFQNEARKSKFEQFYLSMIKDNYGDPHFQVKDYLFKEEIKILTDHDIFQQLSKNMERQVKAVRTQFINDDKEKVSVVQKVQEVKTDFLLPKNIAKEGQLFTQSNYTQHAPNLCLFNLEVSQWISKLRLQIMTLPYGSKLTVGLIRRQQFDKADYVFKETLNCFYIDSTGKQKGCQHNHVGAMSVNSSIDFFIKKNNFRMLCKNNNAIMNLNDKKYFFFFAIEGNCKIKITYPFNK